MGIDYSLYLITDRYVIGKKDFFESIIRAIKGGVTLLQVREKELSSREFYQVAIRLKEITSQYNIPLIVNDRLDIAMAVDADGLHIGQDDLPIAVARKLLGMDKILGYSVSKVEEAKYGEKMGADYLGAGAVYPTGSKKDVKDAIGIQGLLEIKNSVNIPVVAIGGINISNLLEVKSTGVEGISMISGILSKDDTYNAAKEIIDLWKK